MDFVIGSAESKTLVRAACSVEPLLLQLANAKLTARLPLKMKTGRFMIKPIQPKRRPDNRV
jgi:hypothetical protein